MIKLKSKPSAVAIDPSVPFIAWRRQGGRREGWRIVGQGRTHSEAWQRLTEVMDSAPNGRHFDSLILRRGESP
jgi:hypothetical protein